MKTIEPGTRVRLLKPSVWCAGKVPAGELGTVQWDEEGHTLHIIWDNVPAPEPSRFIFGIGTYTRISCLPSWLEIVETSSASHQD